MERADQPLVIVDTCGIEGAGTGGLNPRPRQGETVGMNPGVSPEADIFRIAVMLISETSP